MVARRSSVASEEGPSGAALLPEEVGLEREVLAFVAGYVTSSCQHIDPSLGLPTREAPETSVLSSWIRVVSRGGLMVPSERWMAVVESFEVLFGLVMGRSADMQPGITRRLMELLLEKEPQLDQRIARKLVRTRLHIRLRALNTARDERAAQRRGENQLRYHVRSAR